MTKLNQFDETIRQILHDPATRSRMQEILKQAETSGKVSKADLAWLRARLQQTDRAGKASGTGHGAAT